MPEGSAGGEKIIAISGKGEKDFGSIMFAAPGEYRYAISEIKEAAQGYSYDDSVYLLTYTVTMTDRGSLRVVRSYTKDGAAGSYPKAEFINRYTRPEKPKPDNPNPETPTTTKPDGPQPDIPTTKPDITETEVPATTRETYVLPRTEEETIVVSGIKRWEHGGNAAVNWPQSITVYVMGGGKIVAEAAVSAADSWIYSFELPKYEADGITEIRYTISEGNVPCYTHELDGYNLTNTFKSQLYPGDDPPKTGESRFVIWGFAVLIGLAGLAAAVLIDKRKRYADKGVFRWQGRRIKNTKK